MFYFFIFFKVQTQMQEDHTHTETLAFVSDLPRNFKKNSVLQIKLLVPLLQA